MAKWEVSSRSDHLASRDPGAPGIPETVAGYPEDALRSLAITKNDAIFAIFYGSFAENCDSIAIGGIVGDGVALRTFRYGWDTIGTGSCSNQALWMFGTPLRKTWTVAALFIAQRQDELS